MKTMRKWLAFMLAVGLMVSAMAVFAAEGDTTSPSDGNEETNNPGDDDENGDPIKDFVPWDGKGSCGGSEDDSDDMSALEKAAKAEAEAFQAQERAIQEQASVDAVILAQAAIDGGFADVGEMYRAAQKHMSAGEFNNNAVVSTPGIENAVTVGQGGNLVVNGQVTNMSATISKVTNRAYVDSVRVEQEGRVLNVVDVSYPAVEATINFYMPSVTAEDAIVALQYNAGTWVEVEVVEVRADHVTLNMKGNGVVAFIAK